MKPIFSYHPPGNPGIALYTSFRCGFFLLASLILGSPPAPAQVTFEQTAPAKYRIVFTDKHNTPFTIEAPEDFLSQKALERRHKQGIPVTFNDLPVTPAYIDSLTAAGAKILTVSKWLNAVTIQVFDDLILDKIAKLTFVKKDYKLKSSGYKGLNKIISTAGMQKVTASFDWDYGSSWWQTGLHNGHLLHNSGYTGKEITVAVIDAGFYHVNTLPAFKRLWENGQILGTRDFVSAGADVYNGQSHGMAVLSIMGGCQPGELIGTAPDAYFWLLRSEDGASEFVIEEDNWVAAAEFADSVGADIINTSLGYSTFYDPLQNHTYADMNGNTTRISRAADLAASKGMLVVVSAGNQGNKVWRYITAPADADSVLTVGAVDQNKFVAGLSSRGPSSDGQVKPDVMALGKGVYVAYPDGSIKQGDGTSFSAPVIAGLAACLWQANRNVSAMELHAAICESADRFSQPDDDYGYGIPDFNLANILLRSNKENETFAEQVTAFPNPFNDQLYIVFKTDVDVPVDVTLFDLTGKEIFRKLYPKIAGRNYVMIEGEFNGLPKGAYLIRINAGMITGNSKLIKY
jgi:serine protease AprX